MTHSEDDSSMPMNEEGRKALQAYLRSGTKEMLFRHPSCHPARPTGFCYCDHSFLGTFRILVRGALLDCVMKLPFNRPKVSVLRLFGASIGKNVYISPGAWIDPVFTNLLTIENEVFIGTGARVTLHEFRRDEFRAGRVILRSGSFVGGYAIIGCGIEVGKNATVAAGAIVGTNVPEGKTAIGNPARVI